MKIAFELSKLCVYGSSPQCIIIRRWSHYIKYTRSQGIVISPATLYFASLKILYGAENNLGITISLCEKTATFSDQKEVEAVLLHSLRNGLLPTDTYLPIPLAENSLFPKLLVLTVIPRKTALKNVLILRLKYKVV